jgi:hypothetical protein
VREAGLEGAAMAGRYSSIGEIKAKYRNGERYGHKKLLY